MQAVKTVQIPYEPTEDVLKLLEAFRNMVNCCIHVGLEKNLTSRFSLSNEVYHQLGGFELHNWYRLSAIDVAAAILKNYRKMKKRNLNTKLPRATKLMAKLGNQGYGVVGNELRIPIKPREYFYVHLHKRVTEFLSDATLKLGSVTLTACMISLVFSKTVEITEPKSYVAYDTNERSIDGAGVNGDGELVVESYDLSRVSEVRHGYFERVRRVQAKYSSDGRVTRKIQRRWFASQNNKVNSVLHQTNSAIVRRAKNSGRGIILENLKNIRSMINKKVLGVNRFNGKTQKISIHSGRLKPTLNSWGFHKLQTFIEYKSLWEGVEAIRVNPRNTSRVCAVCGCEMRDPKAKTLECCELNRHINACLNMLKTQDERVRFTLDRSANVAVIRSLNKAVSKSGEDNPKSYQNLSS